MHKFPLQIAHDIHSPKPKTSLLRKAAIIIIGMSLAPLIGEGFSIGFAQWSQVIGRNAEAKTPMLDSLHEGLESGHQSFWAAISPWFERVPWNRGLVLAAGVICMVIGMLMLKL